MTINETITKRFSSFRSVPPYCQAESPATMLALSSAALAFTPRLALPMTGRKPVVLMNAGLDADSFRFGSGPMVVGYQGGKFIDEEKRTAVRAVRAVKAKEVGANFQPAEADNFRFGSGPTVVGYQGGKFIDEERRILKAVEMVEEKEVTVTDTVAAKEVTVVETGRMDDFRYGSGRVVVGYQGGVGNGMGPKKSRGIRMGGSSPGDDFRFGSGRRVVGFQGGKFIDDEQRGAVTSTAKLAEAGEAEDAEEEEHVLAEDPVTA